MRDQYYERDLEEGEQMINAKSCKFSKTYWKLLKSAKGDTIICLDFKRNISGFK